MNFIRPKQFTTRSFKANQWENLSVPFIPAVVHIYCAEQHSRCCSASTVVFFHCCLIIAYQFSVSTLKSFNLYTYTIWMHLPSSTYRIASASVCCFKSLWQPRVICHLVKASHRAKNTIIYCIVTARVENYNWLMAAFILKVNTLIVKES